MKKEEDKDYRDVDVGELIRLVKTGDHDAMKYVSSQLNRYLEGVNRVLAAKFRPDIFEYEAKDMRDEAKKRNICAYRRNTREEWHIDSFCGPGQRGLRAACHNTQRPGGRAGEFGEGFGR